MRKILAACCICLLACILASGCAERGKPAELLEYPVVLYFANSAYIETGDESLEPLFKVTGSSAVCAEGQQYETLLFMLRTAPDTLQGAETTITDKIMFRPVRVDEGTAYVDLEGGALAGGSLEEGLLISQIVNSLRGSFDEITAVQFLMDGDATESLMGHYDAAGPYTEGIYQ